MPAFCRRITRQEMKNYAIQDSVIDRRRNWRTSLLANFEMAAGVRRTGAILPCFETTKSIRQKNKLK